MDDRNALGRILSDLETIASLLEDLVVLKEYELGVRLEHGEHGPWVPKNATDTDEE
jgi:hypothetical protein